MSMKVVAALNLSTNRADVAGTMDVCDLPADLREVVTRLRSEISALGPDGDVESIVESLYADMPLGSRTWFVAIEQDDGSAPVEFSVGEHSQAPDVKKLTDHLRVSLPELASEEKMKIVKRLSLAFS